ncbi:MAG: hypothetical protein R3D34_15085 [Nitratireductor sp.]
MSTIPDYLAGGEVARLFPVLANTSREGRTTSIFLACMARVDEFGAELLASVGRRVGKTARLEAYTEVVFKSEKREKASRPDGLIVLRTGGREWRAIIETKVGNNLLNEIQVEEYLKIARTNGIDAVITISNQFTREPSAHPCALSLKSNSKVQIFHWSWMYVLTCAEILLTKDAIKDVDQKIILNEFRRFISHESSGIKGFDRMPQEWPEVVRSVSSGAALSKTSDLLPPVIQAWQQEVRDLSLILSRQLGVHVSQKLPRGTDSKLLAKQHLDTICGHGQLQAILEIPGAASWMPIIVDMKARSISASMSLKAPEDRKSTKARLNWLLRQLGELKRDDILISIQWPGRSQSTVYPWLKLIDDPELASREREHLTPIGFRVTLNKHTGVRFGQVSNFISDLEDLVPKFYLEVGQKLSQWKPPPPPLIQSRATAEDVDREAIQIEAERIAVISDTT